MSLPVFRVGSASAAGVLAALLAGCAGVHRGPAPSAPPPQVETPVHEPEAPDGIFHVVEPGQTLWRIARSYGVDLQELARDNGIADPAAVAAGTTLWIEGARRALDIAPWPAPAPGVAPPSLAATASTFRWPVDGGAVLSGFGAPRKNRRHAGVDIRGSSGQPILAARAGTVVRAGESRGYGKMVVLDHGEGVRTLYAHADRLLVEVGERVETGVPIAEVGSTGNATAEHCHFELRVDDVPVDPLPYLNGVAEARR